MGRPTFRWYPIPTTQTIEETMMADQFCPLCGVTLDLHSGPDSCSSADAKATLMEQTALGGTR